MHHSILIATGSGEWSNAANISITKNAPQFIGDGKKNSPSEKSVGASNAVIPKSVANCDAMADANKRLSPREMQTLSTSRAWRRAQRDRLKSKQIRERIYEKLHIGWTPALIAERSTASVQSVLHASLLGSTVFHSMIPPHKGLRLQSTPKILKDIVFEKQDKGYTLRDNRSYSCLTLRPLSRAERIETQAPQERRWGLDKWELA